MKYKFFYVPNTVATFEDLVDAGIPPTEARTMLGKTFGIQYVNPSAEPYVYSGTISPTARGALNLGSACVENYSDFGVRCWTIPLTAIELRETNEKI